MMNKEMRPMAILLSLVLLECVNASTLMCKHGSEYYKNCQTVCNRLYEECKSENGSMNTINDDHKRCSNIQGPCMSTCYTDALNMCSRDSENAKDDEDRDAALNAGEIIAIVSSLVGVPLAAAICTMVVNRHSPQRARDEFNAEVETTGNVDGDGYIGIGNYHPQAATDAILSQMYPEGANTDLNRLVLPQKPTLAINQEETNWVKNFGMIV